MLCGSNNDDNVDPYRSLSNDDGGGAEFMVCVVDEEEGV